MRLLLVLALAFALVQSQSIDSLISRLPSCSLTCIVQNLPASNCSLTDLNCICTSASLWADVEQCVLKDCTIREALTAQKVASEGCQYPVRNRSLTIAIVGPVLTAVALVFVLLRFSVRNPWSTQRLFGLDDVFIILAWLASVPLAVFDGLYYHYGLGQDVWLLPFGHINDLLKYFWAGEIVYLASTVLVKISLLLFFLRIFPNYGFKLMCKIMIGVCVAFAIGFFFALTFQCTPVDYAWLRWDGEHTGTCINVYVGGFTHAALNMILDIIILLMPMPLLYKLKLNYSKRQKSHAFIMFSFGVIVTIVSVLRLNTLITFGNTHNPSYDYWAAAVWSMVEVQTGIICACLPAAKVALARLWPSWLGSTANNSKAAGIQQNSSASSQPRASKTPTGINVRITSMGHPEREYSELVELEENVPRHDRNDVSRLDSSLSAKSGDFSAPLSSRERPS